MPTLFVHRWMRKQWRAVVSQMITMAEVHIKHLITGPAGMQTQSEHLPAMRSIRILRLHIYLLILLPHNP
jgi:hypothetical protein